MEWENCDAVWSPPIPTVETHRLKDRIESSRVQGSLEDVIESSVAGETAGAVSAGEWMEAMGVNFSATTAFVGFADVEADAERDSNPDAVVVH